MHWTEPGAPASVLPQWKDTPGLPDDAVHAQQRIAALLAAIDFALPGTITKRMTRCGKPNCRCHGNPEALHGPYIQWTRYQSWFDNHHQLRDFIAELEAPISIKTITKTDGWGS